MLTYKLNFKKKYKSIGSLNEIRLPAFSVIIGKNGSGKSHLLQAISQRHFEVGCAPYAGNNIVPPNIKLFDSNLIGPREKIRSEDELFFLRRGLIKSFVESRDRYIASFPQIVGGAHPGDLKDISAREVYNSSKDWSSAHAHLKTRNVTHEMILETVKGYSSEFREIAERLSQDSEGDINLNPSSIDEESLWFGTAEELVHDPIFALNRYQLFGEDIGKIVDLHRKTVQRNALAIGFEKLGLRAASPLNKQDFIKRYGVEPCELIDDFLIRSGSEFKIRKPDLTLKHPYSPAFSKDEGRTWVEPSDLSSGEKIIVALALCAYQMAGDHRNTAKPKLLLLDELDAFLHPSMVAGLLRVISEDLVKEQKINVIMTTHSPTTAALVEETNIFELSAKPQELKKVSKDHAIQSLTAGVPTLSVDHTGRRYVLTEGDSDAKIFNALYQLLCSEFTNGRSLEFIGCGTKSKGKETVDGGCTRVKKYVMGVQIPSFLGVIDWDAKNVKSDRIFVLAQGSRSEMENCILDPLILLHHIAHSCQQHREEVGLTSWKGFDELDGLDAAEIQKKLDLIQCRILDCTVDALAPTQSCKYVFGGEFSISKEYLQMDGHKIEDKVRKKFPGFEALSRKTKGVLPGELATKSIKNYPKKLPIEILDLFNELLEYEIDHTKA